MKILLGADQYPEFINGAATFTTRLAAGLAERGHALTMVWPSDTGPARRYCKAGIDYHRVRSFRCPQSAGLRVSTVAASAAAVGEIIEHTRPDVVHTQSHMFVGRALARAARAQAVPLVATNHFMPENIVDHIPVLRRFPGAAVGWAWRDLAEVFAGAAQITAPTPRAVQLLADRTGISSARAISCGIDLDLYSDADPGRVVNAIPTILFVGRLETEKNVGQLVTAFAEVTRRARAQLMIVGIGSQLEPLRRLAVHLGVADKVTFAGRLSDSDLLKAYAAADVFCIPGTAELQSLVTLEAMAAGKPVVAADAMALPHLVHEGQNGYLFPPGDTATLARQLAHLVLHPSLRRRMGRASVALAQSHALSRTVDAFEEIYANVTSEAAADIPVAA